MPKTKSKPRSQHPKVPDLAYVYIRRGGPPRPGLTRTPKQREKKGVLLSKRKGNTLYLGWSLCNGKSGDYWNNEVGLSLAKGRAETQDRTKFFLVPISFPIPDLEAVGIPQTVALWLQWFAPRLLRDPSIKKMLIYKNRESNTRRRSSRNGRRG